MVISAVVCLFIPPLSIVSLGLIIWLIHARQGWRYLGAYCLHNVATGIATYVMVLIIFAGDEISDVEPTLTEFSGAMLFVLATGVVFYASSFVWIYHKLIKVANVELAYRLAQAGLLISYLVLAIFIAGTFLDAQSVPVLPAFVIFASTTLVYAFGAFLMWAKSDHLR